MFPESAIAQKFQLGPDKLKYGINWGLAPYFKDLKTKLQNSEFLVISFDESRNRSAQNCQMDIGISLESRSKTGQSKILKLPIPWARY